MELRQPGDTRTKDLLPVVRYSVRRRLARGEAGYWDHATSLELAVLDDDPERAATHIADASAAVREPWEPRSPLATLQRLRRARERAGRATAWMHELEAALTQAAEHSQ